MRSFQVETARVEIYPDADSMGKAAAQAAAEAIKEIVKRQETINVIFATGASQLVTLDALTKMDNLPWARVRGFTWMNISAFRSPIRRRFADTYQASVALPSTAGSAESTPLQDPAASDTPLSSCMKRHYAK